MTVVIRTAYGPKQRVQLVCDASASRTKQQFKNECDINNIMDKFQKTGILTHLAKYGARYGEATPVDLMDAMETVQRAQEMYDDLPSQVRKRFATPADFLEFVEDSANIEQLRKWGLAKPEQIVEPVLVRLAPGEEPPGPDPEPPTDA